MKPGSSNFARYLPFIKTRYITNTQIFFPFVSKREDFCKQSLARNCLPRPQICQSAIYISNLLFLIIREKRYKPTRNPRVHIFLFLLIISLLPLLGVPGGTEFNISRLEIISLRGTAAFQITCTRRGIHKESALVCAGRHVPRVIQPRFLIKA